MHTTTQSLIGLPRGRSHRGTSSSTKWELMSSLAKPSPLLKRSFQNMGTLTQLLRTSRYFFINTLLRMRYHTGWIKSNWPMGGFDFFKYFRVQSWSETFQIGAILEPCCMWWCFRLTLKDLRGRPCWNGQRMVCFGTCCRSAWSSISSKHTKKYTKRSLKPSTRQGSSSSPSTPTSP